MKIFGAGVVDDDIGFRDPRGFAQESAFPPVAFDEVHRADAQDGQNETRKTRAASDIRHGAFAFRDQRQQLGRIQDVPPPRIGKRGAGDQIDSGLPAEKKLEKGLKAFDRLVRLAGHDPKGFRGERRRWV
jgi:hypothetical protein